MSVQCLVTEGNNCSYFVCLGRTLSPFELVTKAFLKIPTFEAWEHEMVDGRDAGLAES